MSFDELEPMLRLLSGNRGDHETHNAILDALEIMRLLGHPPERYLPL